METAQLCSPEGTCIRVFGKSATVLESVAIIGAILIVVAILYRIVG